MAPNNKNTMSTFEFMSRFPDEAAATKFFEECFWGDTPRCPHCKSTNVRQTSVRSPQPWRCRERDCRAYFSVRTGTVMAQTQIPLRTWVYAIYLMHTARKGISSKQLERELGLSYKSAWFLSHRIREAMIFPGPLLSGEVEIDETFIGGKSRNKHFLKREEDRRKREAGIPTHQIVLGFKERGGNVVAFPVDDRAAETLSIALADCVEPRTVVYTDGHAGYRHIAVNHHWVNHRRKEYVRGDVHTNGIESFWSLVKRGHMGTFHFISQKHLHRYINEFAHRQNSGTGNNLDVIAETIRAMAGKRLTWKALTEDKLGLDLIVADAPKLWTPGQG